VGVGLIDLRSTVDAGGSSVNFGQGIGPEKNFYGLVFSSLRNSTEQEW
jgi:hypothetical protein